MIQSMHYYRSTWSRLEQKYIMHSSNFLPKVLDITYYHGQVLFDHFLLVLIFLNSLWLNFLMFYENPL